MAGGTWSDYTYDPPFETTLVNLPGIRDAQALALVEKFTVALRVRDLRAGDLTYPAYGDVESLRNLHLALYQDLYSFAGEFRAVEVGVEHRDRVAAARSHRALDRDRRPVGHPRLLAAVAGGAGAGAAAGGRRHRSTARADAADARNRLSNNLSGGSGCRSSDP